MAGRGWRAWVIAVGFMVLACALALKSGAVSDLTIDQIIQVRLPRVLMALAVGAGLAVAGTVLQALFANPLCEPYTLGVSSGAALGAVAATHLGLPMAFAGLGGGAFVGSLLVAGFLYALSRREGVASSTLLLVGVMLGVLGSSLVTMWIVLQPQEGLQSAMNWLFGDLSRAHLSGAIVTVVGVKLTTLLLWSRWRELDALLLGELEAQSLGIDVRRARRNLLGLSSLLVALSVTAVGMIGFLGLVVPHFCRRLTGPTHGGLIPLAAFWGATSLVLADWLSRVVAQGTELPVGVVTALVGAPLFLWMLLGAARGAARSAHRRHA